MVSNPDQERHTPDSENWGLTHPTSLSPPPLSCDSKAASSNTWWIHPSGCWAPVSHSHLSFDSAASCPENSIRLTSRKLKIPHNTFQQNVAHSCQIIWRHFRQTVQGYESTLRHSSDKFNSFLVTAYILTNCKGVKNVSKTSYVFCSRLAHIHVCGSWLCFTCDLWSGL